MVMTYEKQRMTVYFYQVLAAVLKWVYTKAYRWNVRRKWKQGMNYDEGEDAELDEAFLVLLSLMQKP